MRVLRFPDSGDGGSGGATGGDAGAQGAGDGGAQGSPVPKPDAGRTFTQAELDAIVQDRVARAKPADYDALKTKAGEYDKLKEGEKSDLQKAQDAAAQATTERDAALRTAQEAQRSAAIQVEALKQGGDEELVALALATDDTVKVENGAVVGAKEAVEKLLERKPNLKVGQGRQSGGEFGGNDGTTVAEKIAALETKGDKASMSEARRLKIAQHLQA